jgi:putative DNA primase/helicase
MDRKTSLDERCIGRWKSLLPMLGLDSRFLRNKHGPCPFCGGDDRYRFDDKEGRGTWICSHCGSGNGISMAMHLTGLDFKGVAKEIERLLPESVAHIAKAGRTEAEKRDVVDRMWRRSLPLNGLCPASRYLQRRGLSMPGGWPTQLRFLQDAKYVHDDKSITQHPAMIAQMVGR